MYFLLNKGIFLCYVSLVWRQLCTCISELAWHQAKFFRLLRWNGNDLIRQRHQLLSIALASPRCAKNCTWFLSFCILLEFNPPGISGKYRGSLNPLLKIYESCWWQHGRGLSPNSGANLWRPEFQTNVSSSCFHVGERALPTVARRRHWSHEIWFL